MPIIVGKNDVGKSSILHAIAFFFGKRSLTSNDLSFGSPNGTQVSVQIEFCDIKEDSKQLLKSKRWLSADGNLVIRKTCVPGSKAITTSLLAFDFVDEKFRNLSGKKEKDLNSLGDSCDLGFTRSGRSITNDSKIAALVDWARNKQMEENDIEIQPDKESLDEIERLLPDFAIFPSYLEVEIDQAQFQNPFSEMIVDRLNVNHELTGQLKTIIESSIKEAFDEIQQNLLQETNEIIEIVPKLNFQWKKIVGISLDTKDQFGAIVPLENRGMGVQRLLMVAFLKYLADHSPDAGDSSIFAVEEPETFLHPSAQRELVEAFRRLRDTGQQVIITSHSPVFAAEATNEDLVLVTRGNNGTSVTQGTGLSADTIVFELGILPRDQIAGFDACVFVEGVTDQLYLEEFVRKLNASELLEQDFALKKVGLILVGGDNLRFYVEKGLLRRLSRKYAVIVDSDKKSETDSIKAKVQSWQQQCEREGGQFFVLRKRSIENYLSPEAIQRAINRVVLVEKYNSIKEQIPDYDWRKHFKPVVEEMTCEEFLKMDEFNDNGEQRHEMLEIVKLLFRLPD